MPSLCTALHNGRPCSRRALAGQDYCWGHRPRARAYSQCAYFTRWGQRCRCDAMRGQDHCFTHSPRNRRARQPAIPIVPRTRRQKAAAMWLVLNSLRLSKRDNL
jgi:hypothetical protein